MDKGRDTLYGGNDVKFFASRQQVWHVELKSNKKGEE